MFFGDVFKAALIFAALRRFFRFSAARTPELQQELLAPHRRAETYRGHQGAERSEGGTRGRWMCFVYNFRCVFYWGTKVFFFFNRVSLLRLTCGACGFC